MRQDDIFIFIIYLYTVALLNSYTTAVYVLYIMLLEQVKKI